MKRTKDVKRQLEAAREAIEALDADLAAGRLGPEEHARRRAEHERQAGRLFVELGRARREAHPRAAEPPAAPARLGWLQSPLAIVPAAVVLVGIGVGAGVLLNTGLRTPSSGESPPAVPAAPPAGASSEAGGGVSSPMSQVELQALGQAAAREDAPVASLLQLAHLQLDGGQLGEARRLYERVLAREPRDVEAIDHVGAVLYKEGRVDEALAKVEEALRIDPRYVHAHWDRVQYLYHGKRDFRGAIKAGEAFLALVPDGPDAESVRKLMAEARRQAANAPPAAKSR